MMTRQILLAAVATVLISAPAWAQDAEAGKKVFNKCMACHAVGPGAKNKVGPELNGLFGRPAGSVEGYAYSKANKESGITWTEETFTTYIQDPRGVVKGTKMAFAGIKDEKQIADLVAYLKTFGPTGEPM